MAGHSLEGCEIDRLCIHFPPRLWSGRGGCQKREKAGREEGVGGEKGGERVGVEIGERLV